MTNYDDVIAEFDHEGLIHEVVRLNEEVEKAFRKGKVIGRRIALLDAEMMFLRCMEEALRDGSPDSEVKYYVRAATQLRNYFELD